MDSSTVETPSWLNAEFLEDVLGTREGYADISVVDCKVQLAVGKGENYTSLLYRVAVEFKRKNNTEVSETTSLIIKGLSAVEIMAKFLKEASVFEKETKIYQDTVPAMFRILHDKAPDVRIPQLTPFCFKTSRLHTLILEDLTSLGFRMADRKKRLDLDHCTFAIKGLARLHAMSVALHDRDPNSMDEFAENIYIPKNRDMMMNFVSSTMDVLANVVGKWPGFEKYPEKLRGVTSTFWDRLVEVVRPVSGSLSVLNHGDCWVNNMMFHYSSSTGTVDGIRFVDFQLSRYSSPALDLLYFIYTSPSEDVRSQKTEHLLEVYYKELCHMLKILDCEQNQFTFEQLKMEFEEKSFFGFITACTVLTAVLADPSEAFDMEGMNEDGSNIDPKSLEKTYSGGRYKEAFQKLIPHFENKGIL